MKYHQSILLKTIICFFVAIVPFASYAQDACTNFYGNWQGTLQAASSHDKWSSYKVLSALSTVANNHVNFSVRVSKLGQFNLSGTCSHGTVIMQGIRTGRYAEVHLSGNIVRSHISLSGNISFPRTDYSRGPSLLKLSLSK